VDKGTTGPHIIVTTIGKLKALVDTQRTAKQKIDLSALKMIVIDEADFFFGEEKNFTEIKTLHEKVIKPLPNPVQYVLFSATFTSLVK